MSATTRSSCCIFLRMGPREDLDAILELLTFKASELKSSCIALEDFRLLSRRRRGPRCLVRHLGTSRSLAFGQSPSHLKRAEVRLEQVQAYVALCSSLSARIGTQNFEMEADEYIDRSDPEQAELWHFEVFISMPHIAWCDWCRMFRVRHSRTPRVIVRMARGLAGLS